MTESWIGIFDNTADSRVIYMSESVTTVTGWKPEELYGKKGFDLVYKEDHAGVRKLHMSNLYNEKMSNMSAYRYATKDGGFVSVETITHMCYDVMITCTYTYDENSFEHKSRANTVDEVYRCLPDGLVVCDVAKNERLKKCITREDLWNDNNEVDIDLEPRFCIILDRKTEGLNILYASKASRELVSTDHEDCIGKSFYDFVKQSDLASVKSQIDLTKKHNMATKLRFDWITDKEKDLHAAVEAVTSCSTDGIVVVVRSKSNAISK